MQKRLGRSLQENKENSPDLQKTLTGHRRALCYDGRTESYLAWLSMR